jgi:hypothetical protein
VGQPFEDSVVHPKIYAYTIPAESSKRWTGDRPGRGLVKVGETTGNVHDRIRKQLSGVNMPTEPEYELLVSSPAITEDGRVFQDHDVHRALTQAGVTRIRGTEWFECTKEEIEEAIEAVRAGVDDQIDLRPTLRFPIRPEQARAVEQTATFFRDNASEEHPPHFLWNAKMRFGKNFTTYQLAKEMGWSRILVLTYKPAVEKGWRDDLAHQDFKGWRFKGKDDDPPDPDDPSPLVWFASFQDVLGTDEKGQPKVKNEDIHLIEWDCLVVDEYHFGAWRDAARNLYLQDSKDAAASGDSSEKKAVATPDLDEDWARTIENDYALDVSHYLYLSGTPFRALAQGDFMENEIFNWTYSDEQRAKSEFEGDPERNPYASLPTMHLLAYEMPDDLREQALNNKMEFSLTEFFRTEKDENKVPHFVNEEAVQSWLNLLIGRDLKNLWTQIDNKVKIPLPFRDLRLLEALQHSVWYLPGKAACFAMRDLLEAPQNTFFRDYQVVVAAGTKAGIGAKALPPVREAMYPIPQDKKSITLTCGKLLTGVTLPPWGGIFMLRELKSPESYFQAAFRVQSPWEATFLDPDQGGEGRHVFKNSCYVIDFAPNRALRQIVDYGTNLKNDPASERDSEAAVGELMEFFPVLSFDGSSMQRLDAADIIQYLSTGTTASMLARRWNSFELITLTVDAMKNILNDVDLVESLERIETFRNVSEDLSAVISANEEVKPKKVAQEPLTKEEKKKDKESGEKRDNLKKKLQRFVTRIPAFMYLTDEREKTIKDIITEVEPELFQQVTGLTVDDFRRLVDAGVFHDSKMDDAVWKFRQYEEPSLSYDDRQQEGEIQGGFTKQRDIRLTKLIEGEHLMPGDALTGRLRDAVAVITTDYGIAVGGIRYTTPKEAAVAAGAPQSVDGWEFWGLDQLAMNEKASSGV